MFNKLILSFLEVLSNPSIASKLEDTKALGELKALENFYKTLQSESTRAFYGINHVEKANEALAIETLLITDSLFRLVMPILYFSKLMFKIIRHFLLLKLFFKFLVRYIFKRGKLTQSDDWYLLWYLT